MSRDAIAKARSVLGVPWRHQGRNPKIGIDCIGLLVIAYNISTEQIPAYARDPHNGLLEKALADHLGPPLPEHTPLQPGDIVAIAYGGNVRHCGLLGDAVQTNEITLIHTDTRLGFVTEHPLTEQWRRRIRFSYRKHKK